VIWKFVSTGALALGTVGAPPPPPPLPPPPQLAMTINAITNPA
jgi:hypothetical protein